MKRNIKRKRLRQQIAKFQLVYFQKKLLYWGRKNYRKFPWRSEKNPFHSLLAESLLQRTKAEQVVPVYQRFKKRFPNAEVLAKARRREIFAVIKPLGLAWRAKFLKQLGKRIVDDGIPDNFEDLRQLPAIGPYAAGAFLSLHSSIRSPIIDANVVRLYGRYFGFQTGPETRREKWLWALAEVLTPERTFRDYNYALLDFTGAICKPVPLCNTCPLRFRCSHSN